MRYEGINRREGTTVWHLTTVHSLYCRWCQFVHESFLQQRRILKYDRPISDGKIVKDGGKRLYVKFRWEGEHMLILGNTEVYLLW